MWYYYSNALPTPVCTERLVIQPPRADACAYED